MVANEQVNEAPKKRGRPKGSKNKNPSQKQPELNLAEHSAETESNPDSKSKRKPKPESGQESKQESKQDSDSSEELHKNGKADRRGGRRPSRVSSVSAEVSSVAENASSENKTAKKSKKGSATGMPGGNSAESREKEKNKKNPDGRRKRRKPSTTYINSIVGMVRYEDTPASAETAESEDTERHGFESQSLSPNRGTDGLLASDSRGVTSSADPEYPEKSGGADVFEDASEAESSAADSSAEQESSKEVSGVKVEGVFELSEQNGANYGFLRSNGVSSEDDIYVSPMFVKKFNLKSGEYVRGVAKPEQTDRHRPITFVSDVNGVPPYTTRSKYKFDDMTPQFPKERFHLSKNTNDIAMRMIDLIAPVGKGQRGLIVAPPKSGKTILLQKIAKSIKANYPEVELMILLIDERPEEVTDMKDEVDAAVYYSTFDELPTNHIRIAELVLNRARGLVEMGKDVVILLDSITRLARAYNIVVPVSGRTLSGGLDTNALHKPKRFLGSARNMIEGGSLTVMATALIETGSKMDDVIFEEFKGTGNMELILDRKLSEKRIFPSIDIKKSGTRREELLLNREEYEAIMKLRRVLDQTSGNEPIELLSEELMRTKDNAELIGWINKVFVENRFRK